MRCMSGGSNMEIPTMEKVLEDLEEARLLAMEKGQVNYAIKALELIGKHLGMFGASSSKEESILVRWDEEIEGNDFQT